MQITKRVHYRGTVQGVGFRMVARRLAQHHAVTGYVRNLADGRVELVATGEPDEIDRYLGAVATHMAGYIQGQDVQDEPLQVFPNFDIRL